MATDQLIFRPRLGSDHEFTAGWNGPWPPPEQLVMVVGARTGAVAISDPEENDNAESIEEMRRIGATITLYARVSCSELPETVREHPNIFRGAVYVIKEES